MIYNNKNTTHYFVPYVRTGLAARIADTDTNGKRATIPIQINISATSGNNIFKDTVEKNLALYGAGDVIGFDESVLLQTVPTSNVSNFRADLIPYIEFEAPDFLWRYSSAKTADNKNWIPWLSLIVLKNGSEIETSEFKLIPPHGTSLTGCIQLSHHAILPDLNESWRWAHIHLNAEDGITDPAVLQNLIQVDSEKAAARLMAPRRLKTKTKYTAFVIPTYKLGVLAAQGKRELDNSSTRKTLAWDSPEDAQGKTIPYYFKWSFETGERGDFEYLIRKLEHRKLAAVGQRPIDCSDVGFGLAAEPSTLKMEGALQSLDLEYQPHGLDGNGFTANQKDLTALLNKGNKSNFNNELTLTPPIYGRWYRSAEGANFELNTTNKSKSDWIAELNLDYRHRAAAGLGVQFVKENQEALMQSAWKQLAEVKKVNRQLNYARFGRAVSSCLYKRINSLDEEQLLRLGLPVQSKVLMEKDEATDTSSTLQKKLNQSDFPKSLLTSKVKKYLVPKFEATPTKESTLKKARTGFGFNKISTLSDKSTGSSKGFIKTHSDLSKNLINKAGKTLSQRLHPKVSIEKKWEKRLKKLPSFQLIRKPSITPPDKLRPRMWHPKFPIPLYSFLRDQSSEFLLAGLNHVPPNTISMLETNQRFIEAFMVGVNHEIAAELRWRKYPTDMKGSYFTKFWDTTSYSVNEAERKEFSNSTFAKKLLAQIKPLGFENLEKIVSLFDRPVQDLSDNDRQAMSWYEQDIEQWLMTRPDEQDIAPIANWSSNKRLGFNSFSSTSSNNNVDDANQLVLLIRSDILQKAPSTLLYLAAKKGTGKDATPNYEKQHFPIFEGSFSNDTAFLGFKIKVNQAANYFLVFEEPLSQTNFGLDEESPIEGTNTAANISWQHFQNLNAEGYLNGDIPQNISEQQWNNPAFIAKACTQKSVRLTVPLSRFL